jgi:hypothetical protein
MRVHCSAVPGSISFPLEERNQPEWERMEHFSYAHIARVGNGLTRLTFGAVGIVSPTRFQGDASCFRATAFRSLPEALVALGEWFEEARESLAMRGDEIMPCEIAIDEQSRRPHERKGAPYRAPLR